MDEITILSDLFFPGIIAFSALIIAWYIHKLIKETQLMRLSQIEPNIGIYINDNTEYDNLRKIIVKNYGPGAAFMVSFEILTDIMTLYNKKLSDYQIIKTGIKYFAPNLEYTIPIVITIDEEYHEIVINVKYYNSLKKFREERFVCPIINYGEFEKEYFFPHAEMCNSLSEIKSSIDCLKNTIDERLHNF